MLLNQGVARAKRSLPVSREILMGKLRLAHAPDPTGQMSLIQEHCGASDPRPLNAVLPDLHVSQSPPVPILTVPGGVMIASS